MKSIIYGMILLLAIGCNSSRQDFALEQKGLIDSMAVFHKWDKWAEISDDGLGISQSSDPHVSNEKKANARKVAILIRKDRLYRSDGCWKLKPGIQTVGAKHGLCSDQYFASELNIGFATAFAEDSDKVILSGHLWEGTTNSTDIFCTGLFVIVYDFNLKNNAHDSYRIEDSVVFEPDLPFLDVQDNDILDYAVVKVNKPIPKFRLAGIRDTTLAVGDSVYMIGNPYGTRLVIHENARVYVASPENINADLDAFPGNSGSPVFCTRSHQIIGIFRGCMQNEQHNSARDCDVLLMNATPQQSTIRIMPITKLPRKIVPRQAIPC